MTPNSDVKTRTYGCLAIITGTAVYEVTSSGQDRTVPLRFTAIWAKRPSGRVRVVAIDRHSPENSSQRENRWLAAVRREVGQRPDFFISPRVADASLM